MADITFPLSSTPGLRPQEGAGRLINAFVEQSLPGAPSKFITRRSPGLERKMNGAPYSHTRGFLEISTTEAFWVVDERVLKFDQTYSMNDLGFLAGSDLVTTARNNQTPHNFVVVTDVGCFNLLTGGAPTAFADPDLPASPTSVCDIDGYFVWTFGDGKIYASDLNSVAVNAASLNIEQGLFCRRGVRYAGRLYIFGDKWTAVYRDAGTIPFPFAREVTIPRGIIGTHAVAGWEAGWANQLIWVGDDFIVYKLDGYTPVPISPDDVSRDIRRAVLAGDRNTIAAHVYMFEGNPFWTVTARGQWTWEYNASTGAWNERTSYTRNDWRASQSIRMFDQWHVGDGYSADLWIITGDSFAEGDDQLIWHVESGIVAGFPSGMVIPRASFNITAGVGLFSSNSDPLVEISWSLDGGYTFGNPVLRRLGGPGQTKSHPYVLSSGLSKGQGVRYRLRVSDNVHVGLSGGTIEPERRGFSG